VHRLEPQSLDIRQDGQPADAEQRAWHERAGEEAPLLGCGRPLEDQRGAEADCADLGSSFLSAVELPLDHRLVNAVGRRGDASRRPGLVYARVLRTGCVDADGRSDDQTAGAGVRCRLDDSGRAANVRLGEPAVPPRWLDLPGEMYDGIGALERVAQVVTRDIGRE